MKNFYLNHDGNIDDFVSLLLLLQMPEVNVIGVGVTDADGYVAPAADASRKMIDVFKKSDCKATVARSNSRAVHQFPKEWRLSAFSFNDFPILNEKREIKTPLAEKPAHLDMIDKIMQSETKVNLVMTGPLTDLARAIEVNPKITENIERLYWMGGALNEKGNVREPEHDGTAEWNAYWDPYAVKTVWESDLDIVLVALDSTNQVPLTEDLRFRWASQRKYPAIDLIGYGYSLVHSFEADSTYYLWDVLTTLVSNYPDLVDSKILKTSVITDGAGSGRTYLDEKNGRPVTFVTSVNAEAFYDKIDELAKSAAYNN
ncbi:nucleoside hydrolase [Xylocopilactobacillus apis]|uniref:Nucleoside hydrolase n=1 Tax=Xylocopilactobacillus apis TaxID=2932183 RepID=A0AAU9CUC1_9LACO|nr:nucleoside hydrolase [Xylocopilactobacillus apis]BDR55956.1 nucleoside hydrolase [Xylocopilactobacillus apis]